MPHTTHDTAHANAHHTPFALALQNVGDLFPPGLFDNGRVGRGGMALGWELLGGKMAVLARMLHLLHTETQDRCLAGYGDKLG